ncbi:MAG: hypothetical protein GWO24_23285, partial [Akkermansiaceae bacterium]|nr:hypothetical protein [Akkermansiaceae bacterium]
ALRHLLTRLRLAQLTGNWPPAISHVNRFLSSPETGDLDPTIRLKLAEAYYMNGDLNKARIEFINL